MGLRVAMVSEHASPLAALGGVDAGGQNVHVAQLARAIARRGAEVVVHTRRDDPALPRRVALCDGVVVDHVDAGPARVLPKDDLLAHMGAFADDLAERWREDRPDVVHAHFWMSGLAALSAAARIGVPVVQTFHALGVVKRRHQGERDTSPPERLELERDLVRRAGHIVATCTDEVFELLRMGAERDRVTVIPCGADLHTFTPDGPRLGRGEDRRARLACVGRLVPRKGVGTAISALATVPDAQLLVVGGPDAAELDGDPEVGRLRALAEAEGVTDRVTFLGRRDREDVATLMRSDDALVAVPWYEPFGITPVEAMACGTPVVASAVGGMIDTVVDGETGVHVPPRDPERLGEALRALLAEPARLRGLGEAGVRRARRLYDWDRIAAATLDVYARMATPAARRGSGRFARRQAAGGAAQRHVGALAVALDGLAADAARVERWGTRLGGALRDGGRLLAAGNGGSAAEAQHLTAELVGRFETERVPLSALCLHGDTSSCTAISNDYGAEEMFARQVRAHGRPGDVLLLLSTSGRSPNLLAAARAAAECGVEAWALTGPGPNPLAELADEAICLEAPSGATVQELHLVCIHVLCGAVDRALADRPAERLAAARRRLAVTA